MRKILLILMIIGFTSGIFARTVIKFATLAPEGSTYYVVMDSLNKEIQRLTNGEVKFKIFAGGIQGDEKDVVRKFRYNQIHSAGFTGVGLGEILPEVRVLDLPMLFRNYEEADYVTSLLYDEFARKFEEKGYVILGWADVGFAYVFSQKPILSLDDLRGTKMWMWEGDPVAEATFKALKVNATPLALPDVITSLQTHLIEAVYVPPLPAVTLQWYTRLQTMMDLPLANVTGAVLISKRVFNKISPENQQILRDRGKDFMRELVRRARIDNQKSIELMEQNGVKVVKVPQESIDEFYQAARTAHQALVGKLYSQELLDKIYNALDEFRARKAALK